MKTAALVAAIVALAILAAIIFSRPPGNESFQTSHQSASAVDGATEMAHLHSHFLGE